MAWNVPMENARAPSCWDLTVSVSGLPGHRRRAFPASGSLSLKACAIRSLSEMSWRPIRAWTKLLRLVAASLTASNCEK